MAMSALASAREAAGRRVLHLEVGQPSTPAPAAAREAAAAAIRAGEPLGYTNATGLASLRRRLARHDSDRSGTEVDPARVLVVGGASAGFTLAFLACFDSGQRVAVVEPGYPCYRNALLALGIEPVAVPVGPETRWAPTPELLDAAVVNGPLHGLVIASPSNPTGTVLSHDALASIVAWCDEHGVRLVADEIYHGITYHGPAASVLAHTGAAVMVNSFSKYFSMTGWRLGWMVVPDELTGAVERLHQNLYICAPHVSQVAGLAALDATDELEAHVARYAANRDVLLSGLAAAGIDRVADADGAFYVYADVGHLLGTWGVADSMELCRRWLDELDLACTPGLDFDLVRGPSRVRFSYAGDVADLSLACERLAGWCP
jgi:aspartate/methionine/tyrosine aminotransferase